MTKWHINDMLKVISIHAYCWLKFNVNYKHSIGIESRIFG